MSIDNRKKKDKLDEVVKEAIEEPIPVEEIKIEDTPVAETPTEEVKSEPVEETHEPTVEEHVEEPKPSIDYKEKYSESSKEALTQYFKNKKLTSVIEEANNLPEPTEGELVAYARATGSNYDDLDDFTKGVLKETLLNKKRFEKINDIVKESREIDDWADKVEAFANSVETVAKYPLIEENAEDFRKFCMKSARRGMDMEDLTTSFLYGLASVPSKRVAKGSMLLSGGSTGRGEERPTGLTDEDAAKIRMSNPKEYRRLVKSGKIKIEI